MSVRVPANARATIHLPGARLAQVREGTSAVSSAAGVTHVVQAGDDVVLEAGSGEYAFSYAAPALGAASF